MINNDILSNCIFVLWSGNGPEECIVSTGNQYWWCLLRFRYKILGHIWNPSSSLFLTTSYSLWSLGKWNMPNTFLFVTLRSRSYIVYKIGFVSYVTYIFPPSVHLLRKVLHTTRSLSLVLIFSVRYSVLFSWLHRTTGFLSLLPWILSFILYISWLNPLPSTTQTDHSLVCPR